MAFKPRSGGGQGTTRKPYTPPRRPGANNRDGARPSRDRDDREDRRESRRPQKAAPRREYWRPSAESARKQMSRSKSRFDQPVKGDQFKAKQGDNTTRILPPTWADPEHYAYAVWEHRYIGPDESHYLCLRKMKNEPCAICDAERAAREHGDADDAKKLKPMQRWICYVLHRDAEDKNVRTKPLIWDMNGYQDEDIVGRTYDKKTNAALDVTNPDSGYDLSFRRTGQGDRTRYVSFEFDRDPSPIADDPDTMEEILDYIGENPIPDMLKFYDNQYLENTLYGTVEAQDEDLEDEEPAEEGEYQEESGEEGEEGEPPFEEGEEGAEEDAEEGEPGEEEGGAEEEEEPEPKVRQPRRPLSGTKRPPPRQQPRPGAQARRYRD